MPPSRDRRPSRRDDDDYDDRPSRRRSSDNAGSNTKWIIIGVAALAVVGGAIAFFATRGNKDKPGDSPTNLVDSGKKEDPPPSTAQPKKDPNKKKGTVDPTKKNPTSDLMAKIRDISNGSDVAKRIRAMNDAAAMGAAGKDAVGPLINVSRVDPNIEIRLAAIRALGQMGSHASGAIPGLQTLENDRELRVVSAARDALGKIDPTNARLTQNAGALANLLKSGNVAQRLFACEKLAELKEEAWSASGALKNALDADRDPRVRIAAAHALGQIGPSKTGDAWVVVNKVLKDPNLDVAIAAARAIVEWGPGADWTFGGLLDASKSADPTLSMTAKLALRKLYPGQYKRESPFNRDDPVEAQLEKLIANDAATADGAVEQLAAMKPVPKHREEVHWMLQERLFRKDVANDKKKAVINALVVWDSKNLRPTLIKALGLHNKPETASAAIPDLLAALAKWKNADYVGIISEFLPTAHHEAVAEALRQIGAPAEARLLQVAQDHPDLQVRERALLILRDVGTLESIKVLRELKRKPDMKVAADQAIKALVERLEKQGVKTEAVLGAAEPAWLVRWKIGRVLGQCLAVSPKGDLVAYSDTFKIAIHSVADGTEIKSIPNPIGGIYGIAFSPDGERIAGVGANDINKEGGKIYLWNPRTGMEIPFAVKEAPIIRAVAFSPDGKVIAGMLAEYVKGQKSWIRIAIFDTATGETKQVLDTGHATAILRIAFSADSKKLVTASFDQTARIWDWQSAKLLATCKYDQPLHAVAFKPDGTKVVASSINSGSHPKVYDAATGNLLLTCAGLEGIGIIDWSGDGKWLVGGNDRNDVRVWDASNGREVAKLKGVSGIIGGAAFTPDSKRFFTIDMAGLDLNHGLVAWDVADVVRPQRDNVMPPPKSK